MERQTAEQILANFTTATSIKAKWLQAKTGRDKGIDGHIQLNLQHDKIELPAEVKKAIHYYQFPALLQLRQRHKDIIVMADDILPKMKKDLKAAGINYMDAAGNTFIQHERLLILLDGQKKQRDTESFKTKLFGKAGLKVIFQLLLKPDLINSTIREVSENASVSLDSTHKTVLGLRELRYILPLKKDTWVWGNKKNLLEKWMTEYDMRLKPTLYIGNFRFLKETDFLNWHATALKPGATCWGGEAAGDLYTNYLKPEILTMYTEESKLELIKNYRLIPDPKGYIVVYKKFWKYNNEPENVAPALLAYTDLINTGDSRCIETAQRIYDKYLQDKL